MKQMTGKEFKDLIKKDPSWCKNLKEPLEITTYVDLKRSKITHLSPLLTFSGVDIQGYAADFAYCKNLEIATGTFHGFVQFSWSHIKEIKEIKVTKSEGMFRYAASFYGCKKLKVATGTYKGFVNFSESKITTIRNLEINVEGSNKKEKARFHNCPITYIPQKYRTKEFTFSEGVKEKSKLRDTTIKEIKSEANNIII